MSGWKDWQIGEVVTEGDFQSLVQDQVVQRYANATARNTALGANVAEGMVAYLDDTNAVQVYNGTAWIPVGEGDITAVIAGTALTGGGTEGDVTLNVNLSAVTIPTSQISDLTATAAALNTIDDGTSGFTALSNGTAGISYQPVSPNVIINGAFDVWQRGTTITSPSFAQYLADRWKNNNYNVAPTTYSVTQQPFTPAELNRVGFGDARFYFRSTLTTIGSTTEYDTAYQRIEDVRTLAGQTVTLSFFAKSDSSRTQRVECTQLFDSVSGQAVGLSFTNGTFTSTTAWQRFSFTFTMPSLSGKTIGVNSFVQLGFRQAAASGSVFDLWGVQLEAGSVATPFKRHAPSLQGELAACQRYYYRTVDGDRTPFGVGFFFTSTRLFLHVEMPVRMRALPSFNNNTGTAFFQSLVNGATSTFADFEDAPVRIGQDSVVIETRELTQTAGFAANVSQGQTAPGFLEFSAEL